MDTDNTNATKFPEYIKRIVEAMTHVRDGIEEDHPLYHDIVNLWDAISVLPGRIDYHYAVTCDTGQVTLT